MGSKKAKTDKQEIATPELLWRVDTGTAILEVIKRGDKYYAARTRKSDRASTIAEYDSQAEAEAALGLAGEQEVEKDGDGNV